MLLNKTYYIFFKNLFSSVDLFYRLYSYGYRVIGIARVNSGIYINLKKDKKRNKGGTYSYNFNKVRAVLIAKNKVLFLDKIIYKSLINCLFLKLIRSLRKITPLYYL